MASDNGEPGTTGGTSIDAVEELAAFNQCHNPVKVSSLSSIDTAAYEYHDASLVNTNEPHSNNHQSSANAHPLPSIPCSSTITIDNHSLGLSQSSVQANPVPSQQKHEQQVQQFLPSHLTSSSSPFMGQTTMRLSPTTRVIVPAASTVNTVPEFLCSLTKMLTDNNRDTIEWSNGKIEVHNPHNLEAHVLNRYFRHSKFASFQRQLNYFGFRKLAGKGKMAPCSYVNDSTTNELGSLLLVKRKQGNEPKTNCGKKRDRDSTGSDPSTSTDVANSKPAPYSASQVLPSTSTSVNQGNRGSSNLTVNQSQKALARVAVGKGVRHGFVPNRNNAAASVVQNTVQQPPSVVVPSPVQASLNALTNNYRNSLNELQNVDPGGFLGNTQNSDTSRNVGENSLAYVPGSLRRDDSLVDLAMIPLAEDGTEPSTTVTSSGFSFVDFPFDPDFLNNDDLNEASQE